MEDDKKTTAEYSAVSLDEDDWKDDPQSHLQIAEIISKGGRMYQDGFQVAFVSDFAAYVLGNAMQIPIFRVDFILQQITDLKCAMEFKMALDLDIGSLKSSIATFEEQIKELKQDLWRLSKSYQVREKGNA